MENFKTQNFLEKNYCLVIASDLVRLNRFKEYSNSLIKKELKLKTLKSENIEYTNKSDLLYKLQAQDLFSEYRLLFLDFKKELNANEVEVLLELTEAIPLKTSLVISVPKIRKNLKFYKQLVKYKCLVEFKKLEDKSLKEWVGKECLREGIKDYPKDISSILELLYEGDLDKISKAISLLGTYCENNKLSKKELKDFFPEALSPNEFHLMDAIVAGNFARSEQILSELFSVGKNPFLILALINSNYQRLLALKAMIQNNETKASILKALNLKDWLFSKLLGQIRNLEFSELQNAISNLLWADSRLKDKSLGGELILSELCGKLCLIHGKKS